MSKKSQCKVSIKPYNALNDYIVNLKNIKSKFVSDGIGEDFKLWAQNPVFISAQTGMGKNTFIENTLIKNYIKTNTKILILSNRIANNRQQKERIAHLVGCEEYLELYTPKGLDNIEEFKNVRIISYQKLELYLDNFFELKKLQNYSVVVFDECHFFISDALFNNMTGKIFKSSISAFKNNLRIYMTSTPDEIFPLIVEKEKDLWYGNRDILRFTNIYFPYKEILYYNFYRNYNYICPKYFNDENEILGLIKYDNSPSKWVILVNNKKVGENLAKEIGNNATFITAESKDSKNDDRIIYNQIIKEEKFSCKVLICTSALDNGINLKDNLLKHIVMFSYDKTEFLQMLGRKRVLDGEKVNLYLCCRKLHQFNAKLHTINKQIEAICCYKNNNLTFLNRYFIDTPSDFSLSKGLFYFDKLNRIRINNLAEKKLYKAKVYYEEIIDKLNSGFKESFIYEQLCWLGLEKSYDEKSWISYVNSNKNISKFLKFLDDHCDIELSDEFLYNFQKEFKNLVTTAYDKQDGDRPDRPDYKSPKMRKFLKNHNLSYDIQVKNGYYKVIKIIK